MDNDQNSADAGADNAMARQDIPETVQPKAILILYDLELTNGDLPGSIQIAIPKLLSTDNVDPTSSYRENDNSECAHPSPSTNATDLKRKSAGDDAARAPKKSRASKRSSSPAFPMSRLADLRGTPVPTDSSSHCENTNSKRLHSSATTNAKNLKRKHTGNDAARASKRALSPTFLGGRIADLRGPPMPTQPEVPPNHRYRLTNPPTYTRKVPREKTSNSSASPQEVPPVDTFEFLEWVRSQIVGYAPADAKRMLSAIGCLRDPDTREFGFGIALKILGRRIAILVEEAKEMKIMYDKVQKSSGPCAKSILQTLELGSRQIDKRRDDFAERVRAFEAEAKA